MNYELVWYKEVLNNSKKLSISCDIKGLVGLPYGNEELSIQTTPMLFLVISYGMKYQQ